MRARQGTAIVILGAGFGGVATARTLAKLLARDGDATITLVDKNNFFLFTPMLTEVAAGELDTRHIINPIRQLSRRVRFEQGRVDGLERAGDGWRITLTQDGPGGAPERKTLEAGHVVVALGSVPNFHHVEGVKEHALTMKSLGDAIVLRNRVSSLLERADGEQDGERRRELLTFVVVGGGFTGVETMAALNDYVRSSLRFYPHVRESEVRMLLVEQGERLLPELSPGLAAYTARKLHRRGVRIALKTAIKRVTETEVELSTGTRVPARTCVWAAGPSPSPAIGAVDAAKGKHGGIVVDTCCAVPDRPGLWALGDCAEVPRDDQGTYGPTAQNATREGALVAHNIVAVLRGEQPRAFHYRPIGELAIVGRRQGVAQIYGVKFSGVAAWMLWRAIYLAKLPRLSKKVRVGLDWALDMAFGRDISALPMATGQAMNAGPAEST